MKYFIVKLKEEFPFLNSNQEPELHCYINESTPSIVQDRKIPAMLIAPGGGYWTLAKAREGESIAYKYLSAGFSCFVLHYSISPENYPKQLCEIASAMKYIRNHADEWHIDKDKIAVNGYSAGGHLAASIGVMYKDKVMLDITGFKADQVKPNALVLGYPAISADTSFSHKGSINNVSGTTDINAEIYKKMSLENHVDTETPSAFLWHTANDAVVPVKNSLVFATKLAENNVPFELHVYPHGYHGLATSDYATNDFNEKHYTAPWMDESVKFLFNLWFNK